MPASSSTRKCLLIAWRVSGEPCASWEIERDDPATSVVTRARRVASPSAAKIEARPSSSVGLDMMPNVLDLLAPAPVVHAVGLEAPLLGNGGKARFGDDQQAACSEGLKPEFDEGGRLLAVVDRRIDGVGMQGEGEEGFRFDPLHGHPQIHA